MSTLFLCGASNPAGVRLAINVNSAEKKWQDIVILDDAPELKGTNVLGCEIVGGFSCLETANTQTDAIVNLVAGSTKARAKVKQLLSAYGVPFAPMIHPQVDTFGVTFLGDDITVYDNATLGACSSMAEGSIVFMNAVLGHRAQMSHCSILGPGAVLNARVCLGERAYFGTNASILPDLKIGADATVGANSSVSCDVPEGATAIGVPAEILHVEHGAGEALSHNEGADANVIRPALEAAWLKTLAIEKIGGGDNFFDVGGTSLKAVQMVEEIRAQARLQISLIDLFRFPSIDALTNHLSASFIVEREPSSPKKFSQARNRARARASARSHARERSESHS